MYAVTGGNSLGLTAHEHIIYIVVCLKASFPLIGCLYQSYQPRNLPFAYWSPITVGFA